MPFDDGEREELEGGPRKGHQPAILGSKLGYSGPTYPTRNGFRLKNYKTEFLKRWKAGAHTTKLTDLDAPGTLTLQCLFVDVVQDIDCIKPIDQGGYVLQQWRAMAGVDHDPNRAYVAGGTCIDAYWRRCISTSALNRLSRVAPPNKINGTHRHPHQTSNTPNRPKNSRNQCKQIYSMRCHCSL